MIILEVFTGKSCVNELREPRINLVDSKLLLQVNKPARYTGGEWNSVVKDWQSNPDQARPGLSGFV